MRDGYYCSKHYEIYKGVEPRDIPLQGGDPISEKHLDESGLLTGKGAPAPRWSLMNFPDVEERVTAIERRLDEMDTLPGKELAVFEPGKVYAIRLLRKMSGKEYDRMCTQLRTTAKACGIKFLLLEDGIEVVETRGL